MSEYDVLLHPDVDGFLDAVDEKTERICRDHLNHLAENPYPGRGQGDKEKVDFAGAGEYRLHIGRTWTAFYSIIEDDAEVRVYEITDIDDAHKRYGR